MGVAQCTYAIFVRLRGSRQFVPVTLPFGLRRHRISLFFGSQLLPMMFPLRIMVHDVLPIFREKSRLLRKAQALRCAGPRQRLIEVQAAYVLPEFGIGLPNSAGGSIVTRCRKEEQ